MRLDRRIVFQRRLDTKDTRGQRPLVWTDVLAGLPTGAPRPISDVSPVGSAFLVQCAAHGFYEGQLVTLAGVLANPVTVGVLSPASGSFTVLLDTGGAPLALASPTATPVSGVPAAVEAMNSRERISAQAVDVELTHRITVRSHATLANPLRIADFRVLYVQGALSRFFVLQPAIQRGLRDHYLEIPASEGQAIT